jgi:hypothetical protein
MIDTTCPLAKYVLALWLICLTNPSILLPLQTPTLSTAPA